MAAAQQKPLELPTAIPCTQRGKARVSIPPSAHYYANNKLSREKVFRSSYKSKLKNCPEPLIKIDRIDFSGYCILTSRFLRRRFMSVIFRRRSVRSFLTKSIERDKLERVLRAGFEAPSAYNKRPWEFIVITAQEDRAAVAEMSPYAKMLGQATVAIAVCVNLLVGKTDSKQTTWWIQDLSAATENILLQAVEEGLGAVWLGWYPDEDRVSAFSARFGLPSHVLPFSVVALGYPAKTPEPVFRLDADRIYYGAYGKKDNKAPEYRRI